MPKESLADGLAWDGEKSHIMDRIGILLGCRGVGGLEERPGACSRKHRSCDTLDWGKKDPRSPKEVSVNEVRQG